MAKWSEYKLKETPASEDELMSYDIDGKANKRTTIDKVANNTTFSEMKTKDKTLVGGINEVNNKVASLNKETVKLDKMLKNEGQAADAKAVGDAIEALKQYLLPGLESTWTDLAEAVSTGLAKEMIQIGDIIENQWEDTVANKVYDLPLRANHFEDVEIDGGETVHGLWLESKYATPFGIPFSRNAFYYAEEELPAGTYNILFGAQEGSGNYQKNGDCWKFTTTKAVPVGGKLAGFYGCWDQDPKNWKVYVYDADGITILENAITVSKATGVEDGTNLGTITRYGSGNLNGLQQMAYGSGRYATSAIRQWLNSAEKKGNWWRPQTKFDIAPSELSSKDGFLCGVDPQLIEAMLPVKVTTYCDTVTEEGKAQVKDVTYDKVTLRSLEQMFCNPQIAGEGEAHEYYKQLRGSDAKYEQWKTYPELKTFGCENHQSALDVRLRSAGRGGALGTWYVSTGGNIYGSGAYSWRCQPLVLIGKSNTISAPTDAE